MVKPVLRYIGGKYNYGKKLDELGLLPKEIDTYVEPFVGGGGMLCYVYNTRAPKKIIINDKDSMLINFYQWLRKSPRAFMNIVKNPIIDREKFKASVVKLNNYSGSLGDAKNYFIVKNYSYNSIIRKNIHGLYTSSYMPHVFRKNISDDIYKLYQIMQKTDIYSTEYYDINIKNAFVILDPPYLLNDVQTYYIMHDIKLNELYNYFKKLDNMNNKILLFMNYSSEIVLKFKGYRQTVLSKDARHLKGIGNKKLLRELVITNY